MRGADAIAGLADAPARLAALAGLDLAGVTADSRRVGPGDLFVALPGTRADGRAFIAEAVARGACAVLAPPGTVWPEGVPARPLIADAAARRDLALLAARFAGAQPATIAAVTGTNGKTSTVAFLRQIWAGAGRRAASLGTLGLEVAGASASAAPASAASGAALTTPDPVALAGTLAALARAGVTHAAMEASSHGLDQCRLDGVRLAAGAFTNLTRDHLDYHGSLEAYRAAKLRLFDTLLPAGAPAIADAALDPPTLAALHEIAARRRLDLRTVGEAGTALRLIGAHPRADGQDLIVARPDGRRRDLALALPGRFQADNALLAAVIAEALGEGDALASLPALAPVRGRLELAARVNGAAAYVDYAHTPDALSRALAALRPHTAGKLVVVFGAGGDRDRGKRPLMGAEAARGADLVIVTDDNPRSEDPAAIRAEILPGCPGAREIGDRAAAIAAGLNALRPGDVLVVAGKGHEQGQIIGATTIPFDDAAVIRRLAGTDA
ncbi:MAG: UDP-N-acetylmuramoyl-L-alanyl-D-glutamate--2,6-diaminopimelate ligase [Rhodospirillales bacterium]|nr:UDP-N-acetylmuramoyl-L-alanyl-D-glutamate--2,6-diaminopimelate ligase [Rhodospirillales bacterium]